ncbi:MAG: hypothetical protein JNM17_24055 [Archangium sp.]|nr:hypothetical protein [Archangium sp.]
MMSVRQNALGGRGPWGGSADEAGKREGLAEAPKHPLTRERTEEARQLQRRLWSAAKRQPERRFHALYAHVHGSDVLCEAWKRVKANRGAAGVDGMTLADVEEYGVERMLEEVQATLKEGRYRAPAVLRRYIPKADGKKRPLGIPTVKDRVVQAAAKLVLEPIFEADFKESSYGFRPKRSATDALEKLRVEGARGGNHVLDEEWERKHAQLGVLVRYADDFVISCNTRAACEEAERHVTRVMKKLDLTLHPEKTRRVDNLKPGEPKQWHRGFFETRAHPTDGSNPISGSCVMRLSETLPVSRMREIRTYGLNGVRASFAVSLNPQ